MDQPLSAPGPHIRPYQADDLAALYEICLRTGDAGGDATALVDDRHLFGELYAAPYAALEPQHALVVDDGTGRAVGYVLAASTPAEELEADAITVTFGVRLGPSGGAAAAIGSHP